MSKPPSKSLKRLATTANEQHEQGTIYIKEGMDLIAKGLYCYKEAGEALREAKKQLQHGQWQPWLTKHFKPSRETAQVYMKIAREWASRLQALVDAGEISSLNDAKRVLSAPDESKNQSYKSGTGNVNEILWKLGLMKPGLCHREVVEHSNHFIFEDGKKLRSYDSDVACEVDSPLEITGAVHAPTLFEILSKLSDQKLDFAEVNNKLIIKVKNGDKKAILKIEESTQTFDDLEPPTKWRKLPDPAAFADAIRIVRMSACRDASKFLLTCLHICPDHIEAYDEYNGCRYFVRTGLKNPIFVPYTSLLSFRQDMELDQFSLTANWIHFRNKSIGYIYSARHYQEQTDDGGDQYPDLDKLFNRNGVDLHIPKKKVRDVIDRAAVFAKSNPKYERHVEVTLYKDKLSIRGRNNHGRYWERFSVGYAGKKLRFIINYEMLRELAKRTNEYRITAGHPMMLAADTDDFRFVTCLHNLLPQKPKTSKPKPASVAPTKQISVQTTP